MRLVYLKSSLKCDSFDVTIGVKIPFFRNLITIVAPHYTVTSRSLLQFVTTNYLITRTSKLYGSACIGSQAFETYRFA